MIAAAFFTAHLPAQENNEKNNKQNTNNVVDLTDKDKNATDKAANQEFDIVVTGTKKERVYKNAPVATRVVNKKQMRSRGDTNLLQGLRATTGVAAQNNCQNCNFDGIRLNGLDSKYNQILINSIPLVSPLAEVYFYNAFPEALINRVEVVKGGGSALYGGGAVGGVVNILLAKPQFNMAEIGYQYSFINNQTPDSYMHFLTSRVSKEKNMGIAAFGALSYANPYDHNDDGFSEISKKRGASVGASGFISPFANAELTYLLLYNRDNRDGGNAFNKEQHQAGLREGADINMYVGIVKWDHRLNDLFSYSLYSSGSYVERKAYYGGNEDYDTNPDNKASDDLTRWGTEDSFLNGYTRTENPLAITGLDMTFHFSKNHDMLIGGSYTFEKLDDKVTHTEVQMLSRYKSFGGYMQYEGNFFDMVQLVAGFRVDNHSEIDDPIISPRANLLVHLRKNLQWRTAFTTGFAPPRIYVEDFHLTVVDGDAQHITNSTDLRAETSKSISTSFAWQVSTLGINFDISPGFYYTRLEDAFTLEEDATRPGYWVRKNSEGADVIGAELDVKMRTKTLDISMGFSMQEFEYKKEQMVFDDDGNGNPVMEKNMLRAPQMTGNAAIIYDVHPFSLSTDMVVYGSMKTPHETSNQNTVQTTPIFYEWGMRVAYEFYHTSDTHWEIFAGIKNILNSYQDDLDRGYERDAGYVFGPSLPRTFYMGIKGRI